MAHQIIMARTLAINQATLLDTPTDQFIAAAVAAGFDGVELRTERVDAFLEGEGHTLRDLADVVETGRNKRVFSFNALERFSLAPTKEYKSEILPTARKMVEYSYKLECPVIVAVPSFTPPGANLGWEKVKAKTQERLLEVAAIAGEYDVRVGFEFLGFPTCSVNSLPRAREIVEPLYYSKRENIGLVVDTFHHALSQDDAPLQEGDQRIYLVHVNDLPEEFAGKIQEATDADRVMPGTGFLDLPRYVTHTGAHVPLSVELFNEEYYKPDVDARAVAKECHAALARIVRQVEGNEAGVARPSSSPTL